MMISVRQKLQFKEQKRSTDQKEAAWCQTQKVPKQENCLIIRQVDSYHILILSYKPNVCVSDHFLPIETLCI